MFTQNSADRDPVTANLAADVLDQPNDNESLVKLRAEIADLTRSCPFHVRGYALRIRGVRLQSHVGVSDSERSAAQELVVAVDMEMPGDAYPMTDELERAADYGAVVSVTNATAGERAYRLLETFAFCVATRVAGRFPLAERVRVAVTKATVPVTPHTDEATVEVTLEKGFG